METSRNKWHGKRAIVVVRQSNDKDGTASTEAQLDYMVKDLKRAGMVYVDKVVVPYPALSLVLERPAMRP